ncbi:MAG: lipoprotein insertase outer membrane protein LolB [Gammaproteobacteria bacterium]|nr:lipoprotein insertase outer membrane protein LolB [Gammaproteobacteria bacterium]
MKRKGIVLRIQHISVLILAILLTACTTMPEFSWLTDQDSDAAWRARSSKLDNIHEWSATGRIAINMEDEAWNVGVHWRQQQDDYRIRFNAPLSSGSAQITGGPDGVTLMSADHKTFSAADPESLLSEVMGWHIPVSGLRYWILGMPEANTPVDGVKTDLDGKLRQMEQSGWNIRYLSYRRIEDFELPVWLVLENASLNARIRVSSWALSADSADKPGEPEPIEHDVSAAAQAMSMDISISPEMATPEEEQLEQEQLEEKQPEEEQTKSKCKEDNWMGAIPLFGAILGKVFCE